MASPAAARLVPAQLSFLAMYNPSLGGSAETFPQQMVFYYARAAQTGSTRGHGDAQTEQERRAQQHEQLRQVGLAQGIVGFAQSFANGAAVDSVDTHRARVVLHELEQGWWMLASIDLTQLPAAAAVEYSARELSPPPLLTQQLVRAHATFLLHHGSSLAALYAKLGRPTFCALLDRYWARFAATWRVLLHGSPAVDIYGGIKLAAGGELGMGVGEEEWGSSDRQVLEHFARTTDGLVDVMVSRFGEAPPLPPANASTPANRLEPEEDPWMGSGKTVHAADGVVFSGLGAITRKSLRDLSHWVETLYCHGEYAYGVRTQRQGRKLRPEVDAPASSRGKTHSSSTLPPGIPPPIVKAVESSLDKASAAADKTNAGTETWIKYMTLGYGTAWGGGGTNTSQTTTGHPPPTVPSPARHGSPPPPAMRYIEPEPDMDVAADKLKKQIQRENDGYFLIGLQGDMLDLDNNDDNDDGNWNNRIPLRTIHLQVDCQDDTAATPSAEDSDETPQYERELPLRTTTESKRTRLRPVVYIHRPFIYTFLFSHQTYSLSLSSFYRSIHSFFAPLHRSLNTSTSPSRVAARLSAAANPHTTSSSTTTTAPNTQPIYDLVYDPRTYTLHSSIPNIPDPRSLLSHSNGGASSTSSGVHAESKDWTRLDALNVHAHILATVAATRRSPSHIEATAETARAWCLVWMRLPPSHVGPAAARALLDAHASEAPFEAHELREAFLVRRAHDAQGMRPEGARRRARFAGGMWSGWSMGMGMGMGGLGQSQSQSMGGVEAGSGSGPRGLAEGIGIDARRYVEELLSLNR